MRDGGVFYGKDRFSFILTGLCHFIDFPFVLYAGISQGTGWPEGAGSDRRPVLSRQFHVVENAADAGRFSGCGCVFRVVGVFDYGNHPLCDG